jgi:hypothetical protein
LFNIKFSVPEFFETYRFLKQQIMILFSGTMTEVKHVPDSPKRNGFQSRILTGKDFCSLKM